MKKLFSIKNILIAIGVIIVDLAIYIFLGLMLMNYEDWYDESKGEYWSLESMTFWEKVCYISWNAWFVINIALIIYVILRIIKQKSHSN